jgi:hypothetical protein
MPCVASERAKTIHALDRSATVTGLCCFTPGERTPVTHWIGDWVRLRVVLDAVVKRKITNRDRSPSLPTNMLRWFPSKLFLIHSLSVSDPTSTLCKV